MKWPFWKRGDGFHARGRAYFVTDDGAKAEADFSAAVSGSVIHAHATPRCCAWVWNREMHLHDDAKTLAAYQAVIEGKTRQLSSSMISPLFSESRAY
ncbi:MAG: hypothetical protein IPK32_26225 [Verrucomicrobiaceae bacterium]|nr:hypothetical protein [Verrucomicrobiaceae bacterium]